MGALSFTSSTVTTPPIPAASRTTTEQHILKVAVDTLTPIYRQVSVPSRRSYDPRGDVWALFPGSVAPETFDWNPAAEASSLSSLSLMRRVVELNPNTLDGSVTSDFDMSWTIASPHYQNWDSITTQGRRRLFDLPAAMVAEWRYPAPDRWAIVRGGGGVTTMEPISSAAPVHPDAVVWPAVERFPAVSDLEAEGPQSMRLRMAAELAIYHLSLGVPDRQLWLSVHEVPPRAFCRDAAFIAGGFQHSAMHGLPPEIELYCTESDGSRFMTAAAMEMRVERENVFLDGSMSTTLIDTIDIPVVSGTAATRFNYLLNTSISPGVMPAGLAFYSYKASIWKEGVLHRLATKTVTSDDNATAQPYLYGLWHQTPCRCYPTGFAGAMPEEAILPGWMIELT